MDEALQRLQQGVRRMRPLVVEQQPERDMRFPRPAMVVQERCSRSSDLERMEKRWIQRKARLEMLEECRRMIDRWDEEDEAKKSLEKDTLTAEDLDLGHVEGSTKSLCSLMEPIQLTLERKNELADDHQMASQGTHNGETLICWDQKVKPYFERGKDVSGELLETKREKCAYQVFEQIAERDVRVTRKKKRWKQLFPDIEKQLAEIWSYEESDKAETWGIQMENTMNRQRKCLMELCKGVRCQWLYTRERVGRKWLLMCREKKRRTEIAEENNGTYGRSERCKEDERALLRNIARELQYHEWKYAAENRGKNRSVEMKIHNSPSLGRRLLVLNITKTKKERTRLEQHEKKCIKSNKEGNYCEPMEQKTIEYEMKRKKFEIEQMSLIQKHERVLRKLGKWMKHKFKQKHQWDWIKQGSEFMKSRKLLAAIMSKRVKSKFVTRGKLLSGNQIPFFWIIKLVLDSFRMNFRGWCKKDHFGRICLKSEKVPKMNGLDKMGFDLLMAAYPRGRAKWKYKRCRGRKFLSLETALEVKFLRELVKLKASNKHMTRRQFWGWDGFSGGMRSLVIALMVSYQLGEIMARKGFCLLGSLLSWKWKNHCRKYYREASVTVKCSNKSATESEREMIYKIRSKGCMVKKDGAPLAPEMGVGRRDYYQYGVQIFNAGALMWKELNTTELLVRTHAGPLEKWASELVASIGVAAIQSTETFAADSDQEQLQVFYLLHTELDDGELGGLNNRLKTQVSLRELLNGKERVVSMVCLFKILLRAEVSKKRKMFQNISLVLMLDGGGINIHEKLRPQHGTVIRALCPLELDVAKVKLGTMKNSEIDKRRQSLEFRITVQEHPSCYRTVTSGITSWEAMNKAVDEFIKVNGALQGGSVRVQTALLAKGNMKLIAFAVLQLFSATETDDIEVIVGQCAAQSKRGLTETGLACTSSKGQAGYVLTNTTVKRKWSVRLKIITLRTR